MSGQRKPLPEAELIARAQAGSVPATNELIRMSMWIVEAQVRRWARIMPEEELDDLTQVALAGTAKSGDCLGGLMRAIETFDPTKGNNFWTHATTWVLAELQRVYAARQREAKRHGRLEALDTHDNGCNRGTGYTDDTVRGIDAGSHMHQIASHDDPAAAADARMQLEKLGRLPDKMRMALAMRCSEAEFSELGEALGVSRQYATRVYRKALSMARLALSGPRVAR